jgi:hypothetical protein
MPRYRVTLEASFINKDDAAHWAMWVAGFESIARPVDVISVVRMGPLPMTGPEKSSDEQASGRNRDRQDDGVMHRGA